MTQQSAQTIARTTAGILLDIQAVLFNATDPFILASGRASPVYIDCRKIISYPEQRKHIIQFMAQTLRRAYGEDGLDIVAGGETAGIPYGAWVADALDLPMIYVRKKPKGYGRMAQLEGDFEQGARTVLVEDLATDAGSKVNFVNALREAGAVVDHTIVVFHYGIFPASEKTTQELGIKLHALATWWDVLEVARTRSDFDAKTLDQVEAFLKAPEEWSRAHGGNHNAA